MQPELEDIADAARAARAAARGAWPTLFRRRYLPQLVMTIALPLFNQFDGINSIMFYAPQLFDAMGQGASRALLTHVIIGAVNVGTTLVAVFTVDRCAAGRRCSRWRNRLRVGDGLGCSVRRRRRRRRPSVAHFRAGRRVGHARASRHAQGTHARSPPQTAHPFAHSLGQTLTMRRARPAANVTDATASAASSGWSRRPSR